MQEHDDGLKWFGEGFDGFPRRLPEDCIEYMLYVINDDHDAKTALSSLANIKKEATRLKSSLLCDYIWQREEFDLDLEIGKGNGLSYLHGLTNYGDSVEDEWMMVYLLRELSRLFKDLWIKISDSDGEFLLIEAANALPRWLNPEIAENRVWINDGKLRIIPLQAATALSVNGRTAPISKSLDIIEAQQFISTSAAKLIHSPLIEEEAFFRLRTYPDQISASMHYASVSIPRRLAFMLHECPKAIAPATEAFYLRDPIAMKPLQDVRAALVFPPQDMVSVSVKFSKVLYAQLKSQRFEPPTLWKTLVAMAGSRGASDLQQMETGMKVTCGFEMLLTDSGNKDNLYVRQLQILLADLEEDPSLPSDAEIEGWKDVKRSDSEAWLDISFEDFEKELAGKQGASTAKSKSRAAFDPVSPSGFGDAKTQADLKKMVQRFEAFMNDEEAGIDGAEVDEMDEDENDDDDEEEEEDSQESEQSDGEDKAISFDQREFGRMMREMMGMPPEKDDDSDEGGSSAKSATTRHKPGMSSRGELESDHESASQDGKDDGGSLADVMAAIEAELNEHGALEVDPKPKGSSMRQTATGVKSERFGDNESVGRDTPTSEDVVSTTSEDDEDDDHGAIDIDYNLAENLLESFKSQAGLAGPGSNLMSLMGMQFPRDEGDIEENGTGRSIQPGERGRRIS